MLTRKRSPDTYQRLHKEASELSEKRKEAARHRMDVELKGCTFAPKLTQAA